MGDLAAVEHPNDRSSRRALGLAMREGVGRLGPDAAGIGGASPTGQRPCQRQLVAPASLTGSNTQLVVKPAPSQSIGRQPTHREGQVRRISPIR
jgi:hypothetical protein